MQTFGINAGTSLYQYPKVPKFQYLKWDIRKLKKVTRHIHRKKTRAQRVRNYWFSYQLYIERDNIKVTPLIDQDPYKLQLELKLLNIIESKIAKGKKGGIRNMERLR